MNDYSILSHRILFIGKHLISCEKHVGKQAGNSRFCRQSQSRSDLWAAHRADSSHTRCCVGKDAACKAVGLSKTLNSKKKKHVFKKIFLDSAYKAPASYLFRSFLMLHCSNLLKQSAHLLWHHLGAYIQCSHAFSTRVGLPSLFCCLSTVLFLYCTEKRQRFIVEG